MTKEEAMMATYGDVWHHISLTNKDGSPTRARVSGKCKTWKRDRDRWYIPMKHGLYDSFRLGSTEECAPGNHAWLWQSGYGESNANS